MPEKEKKITLSRPLVLVGLMGCGKTSVGKRIAETLSVPFIDADHEIEKAAGCSVADIFELYGEQAFRDGEKRVMARLLSGPPCILATGGGAYINDDTRALCKEHALTVWLNASLDVLVKRTAGRKTRPLLLTGNPRQILADFIEKRYPIYEQADLAIKTYDEAPADTANRFLSALMENETLL